MARIFRSKLFAAESCRACTSTGSVGWAGFGLRLRLEFEAEVFSFAAASGHPPPVHRETSRQGADDLLAATTGGVPNQHQRSPLLNQSVVGLIDEKAPSNLR